MGTETNRFKYFDVVWEYFFVKLNNPLMGTETVKLGFFVRSVTLFVKLNNPLMGTETSL